MTSRLHHLQANAALLSPLDRPRRRWRVCACLFARTKDPALGRVRGRLCCYLHTYCVYMEVRMYLLQRWEVVTVSRCRGLAYSTAEGLVSWARATRAQCTPASLPSSLVRMRSDIHMCVCMCVRIVLRGQRTNSKFGGRASRCFFFWFLLVLSLLGNQPLIRLALSYLGSFARSAQHEKERKNIGK
ncbi:hypothetical protein SEUBUCD646_0P03380 [Saccharomyces eubayanus]|nr:hypothetical protein SEUBUCD646_0P03380 [Saccharomyces eubayanus]